MRNQELLAKLAALEEKAANDAKTITKLIAEKEAAAKIIAKRDETIKTLTADKAALTADKAALTVDKAALTADKAELRAANTALVQSQIEKDATIAAFAPQLQRVMGERDHHQKLWRAANGRLGATAANATR